MRALLLEAQVLDDVDLEIHDRGVVLTDGHPVKIDWLTLLAALGAPSPGDARRRARLVEWLRLRRLVANLPRELVVDMLRPIGLPAGHVLHPGTGWVCERVLGGALELGLGAVGLDPRLPDDVLVVPPTIWRAAAINVSRRWPMARRVLEEMGALAARRWRGDADGVLRPMGDCDVVTLLGSANLRACLAGSDAGMRAVVVPMRRRGWTSLSQLDPAFGPAAAMATEPVDRGFLRPLLVTADEVALAKAGDQATICLRDEVAVGPAWDRPVRHR